MKHLNRINNKKHTLTILILLTVCFITITHTLISIFYDSSLQEKNIRQIEFGQKRLNRSDISFLYPSNLFVEQEMPHGTGYSQEFVDSNKIQVLTLEKRANYNKITRMPYENVSELFSQKNKIDTIDIDGQTGIITSDKPTTRIVTFFSKDKHDIYTIDIQMQLLTGEKNEISDTVFANMIRSISLSSYDGTLGALNEADVLVQGVSNYGPPFDPDLYQLKVEESNHLFAKSNSVDLKTFIGKKVHIVYRNVIGVVMGEQQLVMIESIQ